MHTMDDWELLQAYAKQRSEPAFTELVGRHLNWVHSAALRQVGDAHLAGDVTQSVFVLLARKAGSLRSGTIVSGWLFRTTRFVASRAVRSAQRRKAREEIASTMMSTTLPDDNELLWNQLAPHLDQAVAALSETDRSAILLRFYERKSLREVGQRLGVSEDAAKKRVTRAIEKMRKFLTRHGVVLGGMALGVVLTEKTAQAAPAALGLAVVNASLAGASASAVLPQLAQETLKAWRLTRLKLVVGVGAVSVTVLLLTVNTQPWLLHDVKPPSFADRGVAAALRAAPAVAETTPSTSNSNATAQPQPASRRVIDIQVADIRTKQPLAGVEIGVEHESQKIGGRTDEEGRYQVPLPEKDPPRLSVSAHEDGFVPLRVIWTTYDGTFRLPDIFTFALEPGTSIGGVIHDEEGNPIAGATVSVIFGEGKYRMNEHILIDMRRFPKVVTDAQGRWRFDQAPADLSTLEIELSHPDHVNERYPGYPNNTKLPDDRLRDMTAAMHMRNGSTVEGVVLDLQVQPIAGASVGLGKGRSFVNFLGTNTDATGRFGFNHAESEETFLFVQAQGYAPDLKAITTGKDTGPFTFQLEPGHTVRGRVVDPQGISLAGVYVAANSWRGTQTLEWNTTTETNGAFEWTDAPADEVQFSFDKEGHRRLDNFALSANSTNTTVTLQPPFIARGSVTDADTGEPIMSFRITVGRLYEGRAEPYWNEREQRTFSDGQYQWNVQFSGRYVFRIEAEGYAHEISSPFDQEGEGFVHDFKLARATWFQGIVRTPDGQPAANVEVFLVTPGPALVVENAHVGGGFPTTSVRTGADGRFKFSPTDKPFLVVALHDKGYAQMASEHAGTVPDLLLRPWARIDGTMNIGSRAAVRQKVQFWGDWSQKDDQPRVVFQANAMTDDSGHFLMDHVQVGEVSVGRWICLNEHSMAFTTTHSINLHTEAGETSHVILGGNGRPVIGHLVAPTGFQGRLDWALNDSAKLRLKVPDPPQPELPNNLESMTDEQKRELDRQWQEKQKVWDKSEEGRAWWKAWNGYPFAVNADGSFRVEDIPSGTYRLEASLGGEPRTNGAAIVRQTVANLKYEFTVPEMPDGRSDEPLDLGDLEMKPVRQQQ